MKEVLESLKVQEQHHHHAEHAMVNCKRSTDAENHAPHISNAVAQLTQRRYRAVPAEERKGIAVALALDMIGSASGVEPDTETVSNIAQLLHVAWHVHHELKWCCPCKPKKDGGGKAKKGRGQNVKL